MKEDTRLAKWLSGELNTEELEELKKLPNYTTLVRIKENLDNLQSPYFNEEEILTEVLSQPKTITKTIPLYRRYWFTAAAVILIMLGVGFVFTVQDTHEEAHSGKTFALNLPDASEVVLNSGSALSYNKWSWDNNRKVELTGEAYFKVAKGEKFSVITSLGTVQVLGTQFNVKARGKRLEVTCFEGSVKVIKEGKEVVLKPSQGLYYEDDVYSGVLNMEKTDPSWLHNELVFHKESLVAVIAEIERHYNISIENKANSSQLFSGTLPGDDIETVIKILELNYHLKAEKKDNIIILKP
ncbi:DUF4974 domain-containing protein [Flavobacterium alkalisoli]|uniref:DUF4974 domain-containing protein n=1 Tax=Flavobacterium alkalisoli TaxID=2602769 RepID=A0A5B9FY81_9FLAO|nr:FecR domain-containing protein [Flavobacterium alkalisoli]QEE49832.1 DUF4974 domain-containing protein [Flavobacterium alkalisoli]